MARKQSPAAKAKTAKTAAKPPHTYDTRDAKNRKLSRKDVKKAAARYKNWGRWGKDDQIGTLNHVTPEDIVKAASLIRSGKAFALGIPLDREGPQTGLFGGRFNPIHQMLATGTDAIAGQQDWNKIRYADDTLMLCVQGATHWDALGHIFYEDKAYNGHDAKLIDSRGLSVLGIEHSKNKMVGRGVLLDIARFRGVKWMADGESISNDELDKCAKSQNVTIGRGDFVIAPVTTSSQHANSLPLTANLFATGALPMASWARPDHPLQTAAREEDVIVSSLVAVQEICH